MQKDYTKIDERFREKSNKLITKGGLSVLLDYPPHEQVLDDMEVLDFIHSEIKLNNEEHKRLILSLDKNSLKYLQMQLCKEDNSEQLNTSHRKR
jgi:hypothetical protein